MTELIINGVDVSECKLFTQEYDLDFSKCGKICTDTFCKYKHNCLLKQLKRKEQECEKYKTLLMQKDEVNALMDDLGQIWNSDPCEICTYKQDYQRLANQYNAVVEQNKQLQTELSKIKKDIDRIFCYSCKRDILSIEFGQEKRCLAHIKKLAEIMLTYSDNPPCMNDKKCPVNGGVGFNPCDLTFIIANKIVEKINEVENESKC